MTTADLNCTIRYDMTKYKYIAIVVSADKCARVFVTQKEYFKLHKQFILRQIKEISRNLYSLFSLPAKDKQRIKI